MKNYKFFLVLFLAGVLLNLGLSILIDRPFKWWITGGLFIGFSVAYHVSSENKKTTDKGTPSK